MSQALTKKQQYWSEQLKLAEQSGVSLAEFARSQNIDPQTLYQWRNTLKQRSSYSVSTESHFARVITTATTHSPLIVRFNGSELQFSTLPEPTWLATVIAVQNHVP